MAYETTRVPVEKSQQEVRKLLIDYGASGFALGEGTDYAQIEFAAQGFSVRMRVPKAAPDEKMVVEFRNKRKCSLDAARANVGEWEAQRVWRVLFWSLKARLIAVEEGLETLTQAFLAHVVDPSTDRTVYDAMLEQGALKQLGVGS